MESIAFIQKMFCEYYTKDYPLSNYLLMIDRREFGFSSFEGWMLRHKSFDNSNDLKKFLQVSVPSDAYCSCALYEDPEAEMDKKGWLGADLIFDIDADHVPTCCEKLHDKWVCSVCNLKGKGFTPPSCPVCGSEKFEVKTWLCQVCLDSAKGEAVKLLDVLRQDFGFSKKDISVFFSGHRGYHVHVESEAIRTIDAVTRKEIVDYVSGLGLDVRFHGLDKKRLSETSSSQSLPLGKSGWRKRLVSGMQNLIINAEEEKFREIGLKKNIAETMLKNKDIIVEKCLTRGTWSAIRGLGFETWKKIAEYSVGVQSVKIDTVVTTDIHRLIRLADTLHSKTGFKKVRFPVSAIHDFDPFNSGVAFNTGAVTVFVSDAPEFRVGDELFGPYKKQKVELPTAAAMLLVCKDRAEVLEPNVQ